MTEEIPCGQGNNKEYKVGYGKPPIESQWKPGESGNPEGRAPDTLTPLLRKFLNADNEAEKIAVVKQLIDIAKSKGMRGQIAALREIFDRIDGRVPETHKIESDVPITIIFKEVT